jgi:hypothetical protein
MAKGAVMKSLGIIVITYQMEREWPRTLYTLQPPYQQPSGMTTRIYQVESEEPTPGPIVNAVAAKIEEEYIAVMIDGARMVTPGILQWTRRALEMEPDPFVYTVGMHLGQSVQTIGMKYEGYNQDKEDAMLAESEWSSKGYVLWQLSCLAGSSTQGFWGGETEANYFACRRESFLEAGGYDERFQSPGGGFSNLELFSRLTGAMQPVMLLGEMNTHQFHGGVSSNSEVPTRWAYDQEHESIFGKPFASYWRRPLYLGHIPPESERWILGGRR